MSSDPPFRVISISVLLSRMIHLGGRSSLRSFKVVSLKSFATCLPRIPLFPQNLPNRLVSTERIIALNTNAHVLADPQDPHNVG